MLVKLKKIAVFFGIDKAIGFSSLARIIQAAGGLVTVLFVASFLSKNEQGYYYTFGSILALQIFFELGLGGIIIQYVAHEAVHLNKHNGKFNGDAYHTSRLSSLFRMFVKWYGIVAVIFFAIVTFVGFEFFKDNNDHIASEVNWQYPWLIICTATSFSLFLSPMIAFIEGIGDVTAVAKMRLMTQISSILCVWIVLISGGKLYAGAVAAFVNFIIVLLFLANNYRSYFSYVWGYQRTHVISYKREIFPYQWKIALSWISGYFIFQLFNPVLFKYCGPAIAGQMGMTLTALNGIMSLTLSWTNTKIPLWSGLISKHQFAELDESYKSNLKNSSIVCIGALLIFFFSLWVLELMDLPIYHRFLPLWLSIILGFNIFFNNIINMWATYLRCHKKEPFLIQAIAVGLLCAISTILLGKYVGVDGVVIGYTIIVLFVSFPLSFYIFKTNRKKYHAIK